MTSTTPAHAEKPVRNASRSVSVATMNQYQSLKIDDCELVSPVGHRVDGGVVAGECGILP